MKVDLTRLVQLDSRLRRASVALHIAAGVCMLTCLLAFLFILVMGILS